MSRYTALALAVLVAAFAALVYWNKTYTPLQLGGSDGSGPGTLEPIEIDAAPGSGGLQVLYLDGHAPGVYTIAFTIKRDGPFTPTLVGLTPTDGSRYGRIGMKLLYGGVEFGPDAWQWRPFEPFELESGKEYVIGLQLTIPADACKGHFGATDVFDSAPLRTKYLDRFYRDTQVAFRGATTVSCRAQPPTSSGG
jgi:prepilin-type processing-associated H-X9-DG protein